jgi:DNA polymerase III epsilon subunit family exonuclease
MIDLKDRQIVIFDLETTGLAPKEGDRICEIAAIKFKDFKIIDSFNFLINPGRPISPAAYAVNHISQEMVKDAPKSSKILPQFLKFVSGSFVASYNIGFDLNFLQQELKDLNKALPGDLLFFDVLTLARRTLLFLPSYSLANVANSLGLATKQMHRALSDVEMTFNVFKILISKLQEKGIQSFQEVFTICAFTPGLLNQENEQKIAFILRAIDFRFDISIRYFSKNCAEVTERKVTPNQVIEERGKKYLVGYCHLRKDERNFAIDSILHLDVEE